MQNRGHFLPVARLLEQREAYIFSDLVRPIGEAGQRTCECLLQSIQQEAVSLHAEQGRRAGAERNV